MVYINLIELIVLIINIYKKHKEKQKEFRKKIEKIEAGEIQSAEEFESTIIGKVNEQTIKGYNQEEILTIPEGALFRTFILLKKSM